MKITDFSQIVTPVNYQKVWAHKNKTETNECFHNIPFAHYEQKRDLSQFRIQLTKLRFDQEALR